MESRLDLDSVDDKGVTKRSRLEKVIRDTDGRIVPPEIANELKPEPHSEIMFSIFFEMYIPEANFYQTILAYMQVWDIELDGEDISILFSMWRTAENHRIQNQRNQIEKNKKQSKNSGGSPKKPTHKPVRKRR